MRSSPTVVNGTVFVGSGDQHLYALDRDSGDQQWRYDAGVKVNTGPTVVDGTAFVGTQTGGLFEEGPGGKIIAIETDEEGSSGGSRVRQGALGHHHTWAESVESFPAPGERAKQTDQNRMDDLLLPGAVAGAAGLGGIGYALKRRFSGEDKRK
ncbi:hypothetical protein BRC69_00335 [Halobacteriales archaeon QH_6_66_25]|nr:MAG: hypothetical protein BRC69_00335 [Halobacteriales archaeon QH_6_66_25]